MTDEDPVRQAYIALIENECNRSFADSLPPDIEPSSSVPGAAPRA